MTALHAVWPPDETYHASFVLFHFSPPVFWFADCGSLVGRDPLFLDKLIITDWTTPIRCMSNTKAAEAMIDQFVD